MNPRDESSNFALLLLFLGHFQILGGEHEARVKLEAGRQTIKNMEGERRSEIEFIDLVIASDTIQGSVIFHVVMDVLGFVLYMHQQIPSILEDVSLEFDALHMEYKDLEVILAQNEMKASLRRLHSGRKREVNHSIRRLDKLMKTVASIRNALQLIITENPNIEAVILVLGASPVRAQHVYELYFSHGQPVVSGALDFTRSKAVEAISRKAIRTLVSKGAGSDSYAGPSKLFLLVKACCSFNMPLHFLPKRDFKYNKKVAPMRLRIKCRTQDQETCAQNYDSQPANPLNVMDATSNDCIWYQCRHVIKGLACKTSPEE